MKQIGNLQNQLEGLVQEKAALVQENQVLAAAHEDDASDLADRKQMFKEEMLRAEAQIDLIKDMLLREPSL